NTAVMWSINPLVGSISAAGLYSAPSSITSTQTVTVTATSTADLTKTSGATITLNPIITVSLTPSSSVLLPSEQQQLAAIVTGSSNTSLTWSISPTVGTIS